MSSDNMVERVTGVIRDKTFDVISEETAQSLAHYIIEEMREPTQAMMRAGAEIVPEGADDSDGGKSVECWLAMVDEALK